MWSSASCCNCWPLLAIPSSNLRFCNKFAPPPPFATTFGRLISSTWSKNCPYVFKQIGLRASMRDSYESSSSSSKFSQRMEIAWLISQQPEPVACCSCDSNGHVECGWCSGTGFFILGDNMLCEVPSRNITCRICAGKGYTRCSDCKGTGYRAKWLGNPPNSI